MGAPDTVEALKITLNANLNPLKDLQKEIRSISNALTSLSYAGKENTKNYQHFEQRLRSLIQLETQHKEKMRLLREEYRTLPSFTEKLSASLKTAFSSAINAEIQNVVNSLSKLSSQGKQNTTQFTELENKLKDLINTNARQNAEFSKIQSILQKTGGDIRSVVTELTKLASQGKQNTSQYAELENKLKTLIGVEAQHANRLKALSATIKQSGIDTVSAINATAQSGLAKVMQYGQNITVILAGLREVVRSISATIMKGAEFGVLLNSFAELEGGIDKATDKLELLGKASAFSLNNEQLIQYSNRMKLLGFNTNQTAQFLDIAEVAGDRLGITFNDATEAIQRFIMTGAGRSLQQMGINIVVVNNKIQEMTNLTEEQIRKLDDETQQRLRTKAMIELYGRSLDVINKKQLDNADRLRQMQTALQNTRLEFGNIVAKGILEFIDALGISDESARSSIASIGGIGTALASLLPVIASVKIAFPAAFTALLPVLGKVGLALGAVATMITPIVIGVKELINVVKQEGWETFLPSKQTKEKWDLFGWEGTQISTMTSEELGLTPIKEIADRSVEILQNRIKERKEAEELKKLQDKFLESSKKTGSTRVKSVQEEVDILGELIEKITSEIELQKLLGQLNQEFLFQKLAILKKEDSENLAIEKRIKLLQTIKNIQEELKQFGFSLFQPKTFEDIPGVTLRERVEPLGAPVAIKPSGMAERLLFEYAEADEEKIKIIEDASREALNNTKDIFDEVDNIMKELNISSHTFVGQLIAGFNKVTSIMESIVAIIRSIQTIGSIVDFLKVVGFARGGYVTGAGTSVSDSIPAMLSTGEYVVNANATRRFLPLLQAINNNQQSLTNRYSVGGIVKPYVINQPIYIKANVPMLEFMRVGMLEYNNDKSFRRL